MIELGKALNALISSATTITIVNKVYPLEAPINTPQPFCVYETSSIPEYSRDGLAQYNSVADIYVVTNSYSEGVAIGKSIINVMNFFSGIVDGIHIVACRLYSIEGTVSDAIFSQKLEFNIRNF
jgi:hypothetical protein